MISVVLYGRNDNYGYNLHKRAALSLNCIAELLSDRSDEIIFVDYNTPDDFPTFPEAIQDTLTSNAVSRLRILRVRPRFHDRIRHLTHLQTAEPIARNVAIRRSNPDNRWILSTNTDMIFVPYKNRTLSEITSGLSSGFYHLPRYEIPETLWESFNRLNPREVIDRVRILGDRLHLKEIVYLSEYIKFDGPGDFQLIRREDLFQIDGFDEAMLLGWHVDANISKRLFLLHGEVRDLMDELGGYHCDHTRQITPAHRAGARQNSIRRFFEDVAMPDLPEQRHSWGLANETIEEIRLGESTHNTYVRGLLTVITEPQASPGEIRYTAESYGQVPYSVPHVLPFLSDLFASEARDLRLAWIGGRADTLVAFLSVWKALGFGKKIIVPQWTRKYLSGADIEAGVEPVDSADIDELYDAVVFDFGMPWDCWGGDDSRQAAKDGGAFAERLTDQFRARSEAEIRRQRAGHAPRRFVGINAVHNQFEGLFGSSVSVGRTPISVRIRHGFIRAERDVVFFDQGVVRLRRSMQEIVESSQWFHSARLWFRRRPAMKRPALAMYLLLFDRDKNVISRFRSWCRKKAISVAVGQSGTSAGRRSKESVGMSESVRQAPGIDDVLSYWNRRPCNIRHSAKDVGTKEYFDEVEARKYFVEPHIPGFAQFGRWAGKRVLEIGCGIGTDATNFARAGADYFGLELSDVSLALAKKRFEVFGLKGNFICANAEAMPPSLEAGTFDLIYSFGVIHHTPNPRAVIENARRLVRGSGELRMMLYARNSWKAIMIEEGFDQPEAQSGCPIAYTYTQDDVRELLAGLFEVVEMRQAHIFPYVVEKYVRYEYEPQPWFKAMPERMFAALEKHLGWHLLITARPA